MSRIEMYPWSEMTEMGDYFIVPEDVKPYSYVSMMVTQRNYKMKDRRFASAKTSLGTVVMVINVLAKEPVYDTINNAGVLIRKSGNTARFMAAYDDRGEPLPRAGMEALEGKLGREMTQEEKIAFMTPQERAENLPWWKDPQTNLAVFGKTITKADAEKYILRREPLPDVETPYPDYYNLDINLRVRMEEKPEDEDLNFEDFEEDLEGEVLQGDVE